MDDGLGVSDNDDESKDELEHMVADDAPPLLLLFGVPVVANVDPLPKSTIAVAAVPPPPPPPPLPPSSFPIAAAALGMGKKVGGEGGSTPSDNVGDESLRLDFTLPRLIDDLEDALRCTLEDILLLKLI